MSRLFQLPKSIILRRGSTDFAFILENHVIVRKLIAPSRFALIAAAAISGNSYGAGTGENAVLVIDPTDPVSLRIGNHYKHLRRIPDTNVLYLRSEATGYTSFVNTMIPTLLAHLAQRGVDDHIDFIILAPSSVYTVPADGLFSDGCSPVNRLSIASAYSTAYIAQFIIPSGASSLLTNQYFSTNANNPVAFNSRVGWLSGSTSTSASARRYFISGLLGYTAGTGNNTPDEIIAMIDRSAAVDGTRPTGTFYFCNNPADPARNVRWSSYSFYASAINSHGGVATIMNNTVLPEPNMDCLGIMTGNATLGDLSTIGIRPGAFCDHLTSFAGVFSNTGQTRMTSWISAGASGSAGTVDEPCNYTAKFPHPILHVNYHLGLTMGESYFRSCAAVPFQGLLYGDPLTRPWAYLPIVNVPSPPTGPVSGTISITATAFTMRPSTIIGGYEVYIDGRLVRTQLTGTNIPIDTTILEDGVHDLRVLARDSTVSRTSGRWSGTLVTNNHGRSASLTTIPTSGDLATRFLFSAHAAGAPVNSMRLVQAGRVLASAKSNVAEFSIPGNTIGAGTSELRVEVIYTDGRRALSAPEQVSINPSGSPSSDPPRAYGYVKHMTPGSPTVVELPAAFDTPIGGATYTLLSAPAQASVMNLPGLSSLPYRVISPNPAATGFETISFRVTTSNGTSNTAYITLVYSGLPPCLADFDDGNATGVPDGGVTIDDLLYYLGMFDSGDARADVDDGNFSGIPDGGVTIDDLLFYLERFDAGC